MRYELFLPVLVMPVRLLTIFPGKWKRCGPGDISCQQASNSTLENAAFWGLLAEPKEKSLSLTTTHQQASCFTKVNKGWKSLCNLNKETSLHIVGLDLEPLVTNHVARETRQQPNTQDFATESSGTTVFWKMFSCMYQPFVWPQSTYLNNHGVTTPGLWHFPDPPEEA